MATSALASPASEVRSLSGIAVASQSDCGGGAAIQADAGMSSAQLGINRIGEGGQRREMIVRRRRLRHGRRCAKAFLSLPALDPTGGVAERLRHPDVVILALRRMQDLLLLEAMGRLPTAIVGEEQGIGLAALGLVHCDAVMERIAK